MTQKIGGYVRKYLPYDMPGAAKKRFILARGLRKVRRQHEKGAVAAAISAEEQQYLDKIMTLFGRDSSLDKIPKKRQAIGGVGIGNEEIYLSRTGGYELFQVPALRSNRERLQSKIKTYLKLIDDSAAENAKFYYRFHNAIYVIRAPHSAKEMFSRRKKR